MLSLKKAKPIVIEGRKKATARHVRNDDKTHKFITTRRHPIYYMPITKCGSTYLKNLFYIFDHDQAHPDPDFIHDNNQDLIRADQTPTYLIRNSKFAFTVLREPKSRFMSLYFDKIYGTGPQNFPHIREEIASDCGLDLSPGIPVGEHRRNCLKLIDWIEKNLRGDTDLDINPHWRPQSIRTATVRHLDIAYLTLDGLDWQLPLMLGELVSNLTDKMKLARSRNSTKYPHSPSDILDFELKHRIEAVYADDLVHHQHIKRRWAAKRAATQPSTISGAQLNVLTSQSSRLNFIAMQKAGCTFVRNLTYRIDHGREHPNPIDIASDDCLSYQQKTKSAMKGDVNVIVLRDPVARFFSLYFDKVWSDRKQAFPWIAKQLEKNRRFRSSRELSVSEHHDNCCRLLGFLQQRFKERPEEELNPHWRPQSVKANRARSFGFVPVLLEAIEDQLPIVAKGRIQGLEAVLEAKTFRNSTEKPVSRQELISPWITERLHALYAEDIALYERIKAGWETGGPPEL